MTASTTKIYCQPINAVMYPPAVGAINGDTPTTSISNEKTFAFSSTGKISLTNALEATIPTQPPSACSSRNAINIFIDPANTQPNEARIYIESPMYKVFCGQTCQAKGRTQVARMKCQ